MFSHKSTTRQVSDGVSNHVTEPRYILLDILMGINV